MATPLDIASTVFWLRTDEDVYSDAGTTPASDGGAVQEWHDQETASNPGDASMGTASRQPTYRATGGPGTNSEPGIEFDGVDDILNFANQAGLTAFTACFALNKSSELGIVFAATSLTNNYILFEGSAVTFNFNDDTNTKATGSATNGDHLWTFIYDGSTITVRKNKAAYGSTTISGKTFNFGRIGDNRNSNSFELTGVLGDVVICNAALSGQDLTDLEDYVYETFYGAGRPADGGGSTTELSGALTLRSLSLSGTAEREAALSASLTLASLAASGQLDREADLSGSLSLGSLAASGELAGSNQLQGALTLGRLSLSGQLDREAQLTAALTLGQLAIDGQAAREADLTGSLALGNLGISGTIGTPTLSLSGALTLGPMQTQGTANVVAALQASLTLGQLGAGGTVSREAAAQAALTLGQLQVQGLIGEQPIMTTLEAVLGDTMTLEATLTDVFTLDTTLSNVITLETTLSD